MSQVLTIKPTGLYSFPNHLSAVPPGGLLRASNICINRDSIAESRRGYAIYSNAMGAVSTSTAHQLLNYKSRLMRHWGTAAGQYLDYDNGSGTFTTFASTLTSTTHSNTTVDGITSTAGLSVGMYVTGANIPAGTTILSITSNVAIVISAAATTSATLSLTFTYNIAEVSAGTRIKGVEQNGNFYFTTSAGIKKISALTASTLSTSPITQAGGIKALDVSGAFNATSGFLTAASAVAYRIVWGIKDSNNNLILGTPSSRIIVRNPTGSSGTVDLTITIPKAVTTAHFYQVYRTLVYSTTNTFNIVGDTNAALPGTAITGIADTSSLAVGMTITGTNIPAGTTISSVSSTSSIVISAAATGTTPGVNFTIIQQLAGVNADPGDEEQLAYEANPTAADLTTGYLTVTDITPDSFLGAFLYTNENSGEGINQSNDIPPLALDITSFKGYTFYSNTSTLQSLDLELLSVSNFVSGTSTLTSTDGTTSNTYTFKTQTITCDTHTTTTVDGIASTATLMAGQSISGANFVSGTYIVKILSANSILISVAATATTGATTFVAGLESVSSKFVAISQFATPSQQVNETALSLQRVMNRQTTEILYNYYLSGPNDVPGLMFLEARGLSQPAFWFTVNAAASTGVEFSPALTTTVTVDTTSTNESSPNRIFYSKYQQPEAVPALNYIDIGPKDRRIIRILALRDNLFVLKEEGIYRLSGQNAPFSVYPFDFSTNIVASDSAVVLNNLIYMFSNQGVATISDTGVAINSRPIEDQLIKLVSSQYTNFPTATFGISYESDRAYYLFTVSATSDTYATQCFRFNTFTNSWTLLDLSKRSGIVNNGNDKLYLSPNDTNYIEQERKLFNRTDYADREIAMTLATGAVVGTTITLPTLNNVSQHDVIVQTQYLTLSQYNRLLTKLDNDAYLSPHDYVSTLTGVAGLNLSEKLDLLITHIRDDAGRQAVVGHTADASYTSLIGTGSASFSALQTCFNALISLLNNDVGVGSKNYTTSTGTADFEFYIVSTDPDTVSIEALYSYQLLAGPIIVYNHIATDLQFVPQSMGDVSMTKQVSEGTFIFEESAFTEADISYSTDLSANFEGDTIYGSGNGIFGNSPFGQGLFGGNGAAIPFRTYLPRNKQRCRYVNARFQHTIAREIFYLYGVSFTFNPMSQRGYR